VPGVGIPEEVKQFIFTHIDSIELLDVLLLLRAGPDRTWTAREISDHLRANPASIANRLVKLKGIGLVEAESAAESLCRYKPATPELDALAGALVEACRVRRHHVYELIFSPMKRAKNFAAAFRVRNEDGDD
jgi:hypothetical protein